MRQDIIIAGAGGQGVLFAGEIIARVHIRSGKNVSWVPSYGPEKRMGKSTCSIVVSDEEVGCPVAENPDFLIAMNQQYFDEFVPRVRPGGIVFCNSALVDGKTTRRDIAVVKINAEEIAQRLGNRRVANLVMVGAYAKKTISWETLLEELRNLFKDEANRELLELNKKALEEGYACT